MKWSDVPIKIWGIWVHPDTENLEDLNFNPLLVKTKTILDSWRWRPWSLIGKIQVVNALIASIYVYRLSTLPTPSEGFFTQYNKLIKELLWRGKPTKIKYNKLIQKYEEGGLQLVDLKAKEIQQ